MRKHALPRAESMSSGDRSLGSPEGDLRLRAALTTGAREGFPWPWCVPAVRNFQPITGLGWSLSGLASPPPPWAQVSVTRVGPRPRPPSPR